MNVPQLYMAAGLLFWATGFSGVCAQGLVPPDAAPVLLATTHVHGADPSYNVGSLNGAHDPLVVGAVLSASGSPEYVDCLDIENGRDLPGTGCLTFLGDSGTWNVNCACIANENAYDCSGVFNGKALPGALCEWTNDGVAVRQGIWSENCVCTLDRNYFWMDCLGIREGTAWPGTPCMRASAMSQGVWTPQCECIDVIPDPCQAQFWIVQAERTDSLAVPYALWIWNFSSGGSGGYTYNWDLGDGTSSTDQRPTHTYTSNGPFNLCLTVGDSVGSKSTVCRSVLVDNDGIFNGLLGVLDNSMQFTIEVQDLTGYEPIDRRIVDGLSVKEDPTGQLFVALMSETDDTATLTISDSNGRVVRSSQAPLVNGRDEFKIATTNLPAGIYLLRITTGAKIIGQRLVSVR
jgi:PKD domain/Secretion system C-terminal sorting domain